LDEGVWNRQDVRRYFELFCIAPALTKQFLEQSQKHMAARESKIIGSEAFSSEQERNSFLRDTLANPSAYTPPSVPAIWNATTIRNLPESVMHLAMNLQKAVLKLMFVYANSKSMGTHLVHRSQPLLRMIEKLVVSSAPVRTFHNNQFGGFVAENYRAVMMVLPWWSHILLEPEFSRFAPVADYSEMEEKPHHKWSVPCIKNWLNIRGIEYNKQLLKLDLLDELQKYIGSDAYPPAEKTSTPTCTSGQVRDI
jgi:hypothetical protein